MVAARNIPAKQLGTAPAASIFSRVANGASATIVPAPPAGFMNLAILTGHNADASLTLQFRAHDADGDQIANGAAAMAANGDAFPVSSGFPLILTSDLVAVVSGGTGGTPAEFRGVYNQIPIPTGLVRAALVMTSAYQSIGVVPASGQNAGYCIYNQVLQSANQGIIVFNGDTATCTVNFRITRGATIFTWSNAVAIAGRSAPFPVTPMIPGDVFEAKLAAPPVVAGSIILRANYLPAP